MSSVAHFFITFCCLVIGVCLALVLYAAAGSNLIEAALFGGALFVLLLLLKARWQDRRALASFARDNEEDRRMLDLALQRVERADSRLRTVETAVGKGGGEETTIEIATLSALVKDLAESVASQEARFSTLNSLATAKMSANALSPGRDAVLSSSSQAAPAVQPEPPVFQPPAAVTLRQPGQQPAPVEEDLSDDVALGEPPLSAPSLPAEVVEAIEAAHIEVYLQPVVTLPQRKVRLYEATSALRSADERAIPASEFMRAAKELQRAVALDGMLVLRCVQVVRKLAARNRELIVACRVSIDSLRSPRFVQEVSDLLQSAPGLASQITFLLGQAEFQELGPQDFERLRPLLGSGCRFGIDEVGDLRLDARAMASHAVRFVKISSSLLLHEGAPTSEIHAADLSGLLARYGIDLIATGIDDETTVADLLDFDLKLGQGLLFSPPRPVRPELLADGALPSSASAPRRPAPRAAREASAEQKVDARVDGRFIDGRPVGARPLDARPAGARPLDARPLDARPLDARPLDARPLDARPLDARPLDARPIDSRLAGDQADRPATLGHGALNDAIDKLRKVQQEKTDAPPAPRPPERRSAWRILAKRVGGRDPS